MNSENALFDAAFRNDANQIRAQIRAGANPNAQHPRAGTLPLQVACQADALDAIAALIECGARPSTKYSWQSRIDGRQFVDQVPLMHVQSVAAARLLVTAGADVNAVDANGWTPLVYAIYKDHISLCLYLIENGATLAAQPYFAGRRMNLVEFAHENIAVFDEISGASNSLETANRKLRMREVLSLLEQRMPK